MKRYLHRLIGWPTRGGILVMVICSFCVIWASTWGFNQYWPDIGVLIATYFSLPLAFPFLAMSFFQPHPRSDEVRVACMMLGVNSIVWGYGVSWLWSTIARLVRS